MRLLWIAGLLVVLLGAAAGTWLFLESGERGEETAQSGTPAMTQAAEAPAATPDDLPAREEPVQDQAPAESQTAALPPAPETSPPDAPAVEPDRFPVADTATILAGRSRNLRVYRLAGSPEVLVLDYPSLKAQGQAFNRMAVLVEKQGAPRDRLLGDRELDEFIRAGGKTPDTLYFGHDYRADDMARFFTLASQGGVSLNSAELELQDLLLRAGAISEEEAGYFAPAPEQALASIVQPQGDDPANPDDTAVDEALRETILRHELSHAEFFTNVDYQSYCSRFWFQILNDEERQLFTAFLSGEGYDPSNSLIMVNEMQAFLMHTPDPRAFRSELLGVSEATLTALQEKFLAGSPPSALFLARQ
jgi:hypothetical protein